MRQKRESLTEKPPPKKLSDEEGGLVDEFEAVEEKGVEIEEVEGYFPHNLDSPDEEEEGMFKGQYDAGFEVFDMKDTAMGNLPIE
mmetsp:Transcript_39900/g.29438  ORF Transcript_39900/g.29438 Transcript_39900/m.29438 type:complete len:85 (+) Transcript_39900:821-1075(+)